MVKYWSSKPTSGVRFPPTSMILFLTQYITITVSVIGAASAVIFNDWFTGSYFSQKLLLNLSVLFASYWAISIFVFLFKRSLYTSYTVVIQRYWKRALYLFWGLELFLFSIYIYLVLVAPTEVEWLLDQPQLFRSHFFNGGAFLLRLLPLLTIIVVLISLQAALLNLSWVYITFCSLIITGVLGVVFLDDLTQTYALTTYFSGASWGFDVDSALWSLEVSVDKTRPITQYMYLLTSLKYWHTVFICVFWASTLMFLLQSPYIGQGAFGANKQNFFFLYGFGFLWTSFLVKYLNNALYEYVYQWFFVNTQGRSFVSWSTLHEVCCSIL